MADAIFIADLHLTPERPDIFRAFVSFMKTTAQTTQQLYILGDLFDYWVGDDAMEAFHKKVIHQMKSYSDSPLNSLYFMPGNRDFSLGKEFIRLSGAQWINDPSVIYLNHQAILLMHGDLLCREDTRYLRYRKIIRNPLVVKLLHLTPVQWRRKLGKKIRQQSHQDKQKKSQSIMDVTPEAVIENMKHHHVQTLIHGHTHRPAIHEISLTDNNTSAKRYVLGDWNKNGWYLEASHQDLTLKCFNI
ncbi:UDP-2,3-diacylglucosamine hydrolase [invertebrate metagenome]|uniref:UDP-2,3-diacylglucosamine hydrolase n=1 Tax=invertebrate metagenome TaxID=1711999 RepID=A0A2H9T5V6_9ZZZZ